MPGTQPERRMKDTDELSELRKPRRNAFCDVYNSFSSMCSVQSRPELLLNAAQCGHTAIAGF